MEANWSPFSSDSFEQQAKAAEVTLTNFGKLMLSSRFLKFNGKGTPPTELSQAEWQGVEPRSRGQELLVTVDASEFNPNQQFVYTRKVSIGGKDWRKTVAPSILECFGDYKNMLPGCYVEVADVPQVTNPEFNVPKFIRKFASKAECVASWKEKYAGNGNGNGHASSPPAVSVPAVPEAVVSELKALWAAIHDETQFKSYVAGVQNYAQYPLDVVMALAKS